MAKLVKVGKVPGTVSEIALENGENIAETAELAALDIEGYQPRLNGVPCELTDVPEDGDVILFMKKIKGN